MVTQYFVPDTVSIEKFKAYLQKLHVHVACVIFVGSLNHHLHACLEITAIRSAQGMNVGQQLIPPCLNEQAAEF